MNKLYILITFLLCLGCSNRSVLKLPYIKESKTLQEKINLHDYPNLFSPFIDSIKFGYLDSISFENGNPNRMRVHNALIKLNFKKTVKKYSPEYYALGTAYFTTKSMSYYTNLFRQKIDFNTQQDYQVIEVIIGDVPLLTSPNQYIFKRGSLLSPSLFYHEVGHRAFWMLESDLGIKFNGLSVIHMGLLEYFTTSLNNSPLVGEENLPSRLVRNASLLYTYPYPDSLYLSATFSLLKESYKNELKDSAKNISKYYNSCTKYYGDKLSKRIDNHRGGLVITGILWRVRKQLGQSEADKLVAETILGLNDYMDERPKFYKNDIQEDLPDEICWYDLYYGLLMKDKELFQGKNRLLLTTEFKRAGFPVDKIVVCL